MKNAYLLLLITLSCITLSAQNNLSDGYIITNNNDTVYGQIDLRTDKINQTRCLFVSNRNGNTQQNFYPNDIKGYRFTKNGKYYISKTISIENETLTAFVEYLVQGKLSLFYYINEINDQSYFIFDEAGKETFYITQRINPEIATITNQDQRYIGRLQYYFQNSSPSIIAQTEKTKFTQTSMIKIVKEYNDENCQPNQESCIIFENQNPDKIGIEFIFSAYTGIQNVKYEYSNLISESSSFPVIGGQLFICNPKWSKSIGAVLDLSFSKMKKEFLIYDDGYERSFNSKYDLYTLTTKLGFRYTYSKFRLKPSIDLGFACFTLLNNEIEATDESSTWTIHQIKKWNVGYYLGAGLEYNTYREQSVFFRFNLDFYSKSYFGVDRTYDKIGLWQIKLGYTF